MWIAWPAKYLYWGMLVRISVQTSVNLHAVLLAACYTFTFTVCNENHYLRGANSAKQLLKSWCVKMRQLFTIVFSKASCQEAFAKQTWPHHRNSSLICNNSNGLLHALVHRPLWHATLWICIVTVVLSAPLTQTWSQYLPWKMNLHVYRIQESCGACGQNGISKTPLLLHNMQKSSQGRACINSTKQPLCNDICMPCHSQDAWQTNRMAGLCTDHLKTQPAQANASCAVAGTAVYCRNTCIL